MIIDISEISGLFDDKDVDYRVRPTKRERLHKKHRKKWDKAMKRKLLGLQK